MVNYSYFSSVEIDIRKEKATTTISRYADCRINACARAPDMCDCAPEKRDSPVSCVATDDVHEKMEITAKTEPNQFDHDFMYGSVIICFRPFGRRPTGCCDCCDCCVRSRALQTTTEMYSCVRFEYMRTLGCACVCV